MRPRPVLVSLILFTMLLAPRGSAADEPITCTGAWSAALSEQALVRMFGRQNVVKGMIYVAEGDEVPGTVVFPNDKTRRLEVVWRDARRRRSPEWIRVPEGSRWVTFARIRNGLSLADVEKMNGRPFSLYGFDWDYAGAVANWRGGRLDDPGFGCSLQLQFDRTIPDRPTAAQQSALDATSGDRELLSSSSSLRRFPTYLREIIIRYPE